MKSSTIAAIVAGCGLVVVAVTVTLVFTLQEDKPKPRLESVVARASQGYLVGKVTPQAGIFWGIPFSQPPVGEYRWKNPRDPLPFPGDYWDATYIRPACIQTCNNPAVEYSCPTEHDEDCLYLNVFVPSRLLTRTEEADVIDGEHYVIAEDYHTGDESSLAVMLWLYGGNFISGAGSVPLYDGRYLADHGNVVIVTMNYRLGPLGYLVQGDGEDAAMGNFGIWDQIKAMEWIQSNIKWFGGNPNKVTLYGQSAGAESMGVLMTSPYVRNRGLFHQCIMESNPFGLPFRDWDNAREFGSRFADAAGCLPHDMKCLRSLDSEQVLQAYRDSASEVVGLEKVLLIFQPWAPVIKSDFLPEQPVDVFMRGEALDIPCIIGGTADEGMLYIAVTFPNPVDNVGYRAVVKAVVKNESRLVVQEYPPLCRPVLPGNCDNRYLMNPVSTDYIFLCPQRACLNSMGSESWFYIFNETWSFYELWEIPMCFDTVCHGGELPYVTNFENLTVYRYTDGERALSYRMGWYWTNFAKYGNPNGDVSTRHEDESPLAQVNGEDFGAIYWPKYGEADEDGEYKALQLTGEGDFVMNEPYKEKCDFWDELDSYADH